MRARGGGKAEKKKKMEWGAATPSFLSRSKKMLGGGGNVLDGENREVKEGTGRGQKKITAEDALLQENIEKGIDEREGKRSNGHKSAPQLGGGS